MAQKSEVTDWLAEHPKMIGALWTMMLLLAQAGNAAAGGVTTRVGP